MLAVLVVVACQDSTQKEFYPLPAIGRAAHQSSGEAPVPEAPELTPEEHEREGRDELLAAGGDDRAIHQRMQENFIRADQLQKAIIAGDLEAAKRNGRWLATHMGTRGLPDAWIAHITAMRRAAQAVVDAPDIEGASRATAYVAGACGSCHLIQLGGRDLGAEPLPRAGASKTELLMKRHQWAVDRMWDAVVSGKESRWDEAVDLLERSALSPKDFDRPRAKPALTEYTRRLSRIVERARGARAPDVRVKVLGDFLATCSGCHRALDAGPEAW